MKAGAAVTVTNDDGTVHTLTADKGQFDTGDLDGGAKRHHHHRRSPASTRTTATIHNYMTGTIEAT